MMSTDLRVDTRKGSRRCMRIQQGANNRDLNVLSPQRNITSFVKHFITNPPTPDFSTLVDETNSSNYVAMQGRGIK